MARLFNMQVYGDVIMGTAAVYTDPRFDETLASADALVVQAIADQVTGTSPTLSVVIEHSGDRRNWIQKGSTPIINAAALSTSALTVTSGNDPGSTPSLGFVRLRISLGGMSPTGRITLHACGRSL